MSFVGCPECGGGGTFPCNDCQGSGLNGGADENDPLSKKMCRRCHGRGFSHCGRCIGTGIVDA